MKFYALMHSMLFYAIDATCKSTRAFACQGERVGKFPGAEKFPEEVGANIQINFRPMSAVRSVISPLHGADRRFGVESTTY